MNAAFREAANGPQKGVLAVVDEPLVSVDYRCTDVSTSLDASLTMARARRPHHCDGGGRSCGAPL